MNRLVLECNDFLKDGGFDYAFCGGFAIELFCGKVLRSHGDIDIAAFWDDRDKIILYMKLLGWKVYEMCGGGLAHHIKDISDQKKLKRNIFCFTEGCELINLHPTDEADMFRLDFDHRGQKKLNFIEFLFNDERNENFLYARNHDISLPMDKAILYKNSIPYLSPEIVLLYKSTDIEREGYQLDYDLAIQAMSAEQKIWLKNALKTMNPYGHKWLEINVDTKSNYLQNPCRRLSTAFWKKYYFSKPDNLHIAHKKDLNTSLCNIDKATCYFRLIHYPQKDYDITFTDGFNCRTVNLPSESSLVADIINRCYSNSSIKVDDVYRWMQFPVFDNDLWVFICDKQNMSPVALGIADFDSDMGEGSLEWIQVLPEYRGCGLGTSIVLELLSRLKEKASFITVSGEVNNPTNPESLYRKCGFSGDDVWCVFKNGETK